MSSSFPSQKGKVTGLILAAGKGTRMKSNLPKCLHKVCGIPMAKLVADQMMAAGVDEVILVVGHGGEQLISTLGSGYKYAWQLEQLGTGHAVQCAMKELGDIHGTIVIACGDTPLISTEYFRNFINSHLESNKVCSVSVAQLPNAHGYGRVVIEDGNAIRIVEQKDATTEELQIPFANAGMYCVDAQWLTQALTGLNNNNKSGEYYLTDIIKNFSDNGNPANAFISTDSSILMGVNDRLHLAEANQILKDSINRKWMTEGVTIVDPNNTYIGPFVTIGQDTVIEPGTHLLGQTSIGFNCVIGPNARMIDVKVGNDCNIFLTQADVCSIGNNVKIGPFANIRPKSILGDDVKIGNFVEVNRSQLANGVKASHLTYLGDSTVGEETNIGAGTITCNFDGFQKHRTSIGKDAFVGSNSTLVAPLTIGDGTVIGAGSVITDDVPENALALGRARQVTKLEYASLRRKQKAQES
jgi:bifunctional UDP-N-acetylglucosamine pyrophosphorylase/glucosamine-1-phosphate N-acetyltransferase